MKKPTWKECHNETHFRNSMRLYRDAQIMTVGTKFTERTFSEIGKYDEPLCMGTLGDRLDMMYQAWVNSGGSAHLFWVKSKLYARGNKMEREYARGFVSAWRLAMRIERDDDE